MCRITFRINKLGHYDHWQIQYEVYGLSVVYRQLLPGDWYAVRAFDGCGSSVATNDARAFVELYKRARASTIQTCLQVSENGEKVHETWG
jgi:hypothetical protein